MKILELTLNPMMTIPGDPMRFRVGDPVVEGGRTVEKINFHPPTGAFNKANEVAASCYAIYFVGIPERRLVMADVVTSVEAVKETTKKTDNTEATVELPE